jgi:aerobic-type carbon monoxide dehydrogenase small subunit (CoxS/CutS family)
MKRDSSPDHSSTRGSFLTAPVTRRTFLQGLGTTAVAAAALGTRSVAADLAEANAERPIGPGAAAVALSINGEKSSFALEPRTTLLEALRIHAGLTGPKEVCERATCGACTVLLDGVPVYACMMLAIEAVGHEVTTIEGLSREGLNAIQAAIVEHDGLQCGYCTPGFVVSLTALLKANPTPSTEEIRKAVSGHICRCGSYVGVLAAAKACANRNRQPANA